jgi:hypothetical protein
MLRERKGVKYIYIYIYIFFPWASFVLPITANPRF